MEGKDKSPMPARARNVVRKVFCKGAKCRTPKPLLVKSKSRLSLAGRKCKQVAQLDPQAGGDSRRPPSSALRNSSFGKETEGESQGEEMSDKENCYLPRRRVSKVQPAFKMKVMCDGEEFRAPKMILVKSDTGINVFGSRSDSRLEECSPDRVLVLHKGRSSPDCREQPWTCRRPVVVVVSKKDGFRRDGDFEFPPAEPCGGPISSDDNTIFFPPGFRTFDKDTIRVRSKPSDSSSGLGTEADVETRDAKVGTGTKGILDPLAPQSKRLNFRGEESEPESYVEEDSSSAAGGATTTSGGTSGTSSGSEEEPLGTASGEPELQRTAREAALEKELDRCKAKIQELTRQLDEERGFYLQQKKEFVEIMKKKEKSSRVIENWMITNLKENPFKENIHLKKMLRRLSGFLNRQRIETCNVYHRYMKLLEVHSRLEEKMKIQQHFYATKIRQLFKKWDQSRSACAINEKKFLCNQKVLQQLVRKNARLSFGNSALQLAMERFITNVKNKNNLDPGFMIARERREIKRIMDKKVNKFEGENKKTKKLKRQDEAVEIQLQQKNSQLLCENSVLQLKIERLNKEMRKMRNLESKMKAEMEKRGTPTRPKKKMKKVMIDSCTSPKRRPPADLSEGIQVKQSMRGFWDTWNLTDEWSRSVEGDSTWPPCCQTIARTESAPDIIESS